MKTIDEAIAEQKILIDQAKENLNIMTRAKAILGGKAPGISILHGKAGSRDGIRPDSAVGQAVAVLRDAAKPLHIDEIVKRVTAKGGAPNKASLVSSLHRHAKKRSVFVKTKKPGEFGLLALGHGRETAET